MAMRPWRIYYINNKNDLYVFGDVIGADEIPQKILSKVRYVFASSNDYAITNNGTLYDLSDIYYIDKDKPKKKAKGL